MAVDGRFWEGLRDFVPAPDAIDNEFSTRLTTPNLLSAARAFSTVLYDRGRPIRGAAWHTNRPLPSVFLSVAATVGSRTPSIEDLLGGGGASLGIVGDSLARNPRHIESFAALCRFVKLRGA